jgi:transcription elongation factor Elf1
MPDKELTCPCGEHEYVVCYERRGKKEQPTYCPFCGADGATEGIELEENEDDDE